MPQLQVAQTILQQIKAGRANGYPGVMTMGCWGTRQLEATEQGLKFKVTGRLLRGAVHVMYNRGSDMYDIAFLNLRGREVKRVEGIFCDELTNTIDEVVESGVTA